MSDKPHSCWWKQQADGVLDIAIYTEDLNAVKKFKNEHSGVYSDSKGKIFAMQFFFREGSDKQKELFDLLGLTDEDEKKEKRHRRTKVEMEVSRSTKENK